MGVGGREAKIEDEGERANRRSNIAHRFQSLAMICVVLYFVSLIAAHMAHSAELSLKYRAIRSNMHAYLGVPLSV